MVKNCDNCAHDAPVISEACKTCERIRKAWSGEPWSEPSNWKPKAVTNADRIRSMSDEELARFIPDWSYTNACKCDEHPHVDCNNECEKCVLEWLKEPYKEDAP